MTKQEYDAMIRAPRTATIEPLKWSLIHQSGSGRLRCNLFRHSLPLINLLWPEQVYAP